MDEHRTDEDQRIVQEIAGRFDAPSFIRRAKHVDLAWSELVDRLAMLRRQNLEMVRLRLGQLKALAGGWEVLRPILPGADDLAELERLHAELQPRLRLPLEPTASRRQLRSALRDLAEVMERFNARWSKLVAETDLKPVNDVREAYNRYFLIEKECALGSARVVRIGFQRLEPLTLDDVRQRFPLLKIPAFH